MPDKPLQNLSDTELLKRAGDLVDALGEPGRELGQLVAEAERRRLAQLYLSSLEPIQAELTSAVFALQALAKLIGGGVDGLPDSPETVRFLDELRPKLQGLNLPLNKAAELFLALVETVNRQHGDLGAAVGSPRGAARPN